MSDFKCGNCCSTMSASGCSKRADKLNTYDWFADLPDNAAACDIVEVQFKPPRKGYFLNTNKLQLAKGDIVAVEANPGHDIGTVTMTGRLVPLQLKKTNPKPGTELKKIYRKARQVDIDKFNEAKSREHETMIESRQIALRLGLNMKIGDVEYQGDGNKAIFYYIADERVDFRQLIKVLADRFRVRIEMKQIGARQEAGRIGGIGPCGRELCCSTWMTNFVSVSTSAARFQDISLNPQKLAGQCAKLKCCMNYEVDQYMEALKRLPSREISLLTQDNEYFFFKADILSHKITYSTDKKLLVGEKTITARRAFEIIQMNRNGIKPEALVDNEQETEPVATDLLSQDNINRFDSKNPKRKKGQNKKQNRPAGDNQGAAATGDKKGNAKNDNKRQDGKRQDRKQNNKQDGRPANKPAEGKPTAEGKPSEGKPTAESKPSEGKPTAESKLSEGKPTAESKQPQQ